MKFFFLIYFSLFLAVLASAQTSSTVAADSASYEAQRVQVNKLLDDRSHKFGEYDLSLEKKTGIFGIFKTKGDMQKSIDILRQIVITDNNIFLETKKLLDYKDFEREKFQRMAADYDNQVTQYMKTVSKLQEENEKLTIQVAELENRDHSDSVYIYVGIFFILILSAIIFMLYKKLHAQKVT
ncbi:hypothetical protein [Sphingobacterium hungaricum]